MIMAAGMVPRASPKWNRLMGTVDSSGRLASCWPARPPTAMTMAGLVPFNACMAESTYVLRRELVEALIGAVFMLFLVFEFVISKPVQQIIVQTPLGMLWKKSGSQS